MNRRPVALALCFVALSACGGSKARPTSEPTPEVSRPLAAFAATRIIALPTQRLGGGDATEWSSQIRSSRLWLASLDSAVEAQLRDRQVASSWAFPADLVRSAKRNPIYATDPSGIRAGDAVRLLERHPEGQLAEPVASQLRALAGIHDARYAFVPVEVRFEPTSRDGKRAGGRAILHAAVLDVRASKLSWTGDVASDTFPALSAALVSSLASRVADLIVAR